MTAMQLHVQGRADAARAAYEALLAEWSDEPEILHPLGMLHMSEKRWADAERCFERAFRAAPHDPRQALGLAQTRVQQRKIQPALEALLAFIAINPGHTEVLEFFYRLAPAAPDFCCKSMEEMVAAHPDDLTLRAATAGLYLTLGQPAEELRHLEVLSRHGGESEPFLLQYAMSLRNANHLDAAMKACERGLAAAPDSTKLLKLRGDLFLLMGKGAKALDDFERTYALAPTHHTRLRIAAAKLLLSDLREGFTEFSAHRDLEIELHKFAFSIPEWNGEPLKGKRLLVWASQGIGDIFMFAGFLPWVIEQGAHVTLALYPKLMPLFARSFPDARVEMLTLEMPQKLGPECDYHIPIGQLMTQVLPRYTPAAHPPYLKADTALAKQLREKYLADSGTRKKLIGISWHTTNSDSSNVRSIPLDLWRPLFALPHVQFVSLQYGHHAEAIARVAREFPGAFIADATIDAYYNTDALAAQIASMDEVITIDNSTVHLAGALGTPTTLLLSAASEWRWGYGHTQSRWYKSLRVERQEKLFDWQPVMERVRQRLA